MPCPIITDGITSTSQTLVMFAALVGAALVYRMRKTSSPENFGWPLLGDVQLLYDMLGFFKKRKGMGVTKTHLFGKEIIVVPTSLETDQILRGDGTLVEVGGAPLPSLKYLLGPESLFVCSGDEHKRVKNSVIACFRPSVLSHIAPVIHETTMRFLDKWSAAGYFDASTGISALDLDIGLSFVGINVDAFDDDTRLRIDDAVSATLLAFISLPIDLGRFSAFGRGMAGRQYLKEILLKAVKDRRSEADNNPTSTREDVMQKMLEICDARGDPLTDDAMTDQLLNFVLAAYDNTSAVINSLVVNLCKRPDIQDRAHDHIRSILGAESDEYHGRSCLTREHLQKLCFVEQIIFESERMNTPSPITSVRNAACDFVLGGVSVHKGAIILVDAYSRCFNPEYWSKPNIFDPDRFGDERREHKRVGASQTVTFGGGAKGCVGKAFANFHLKIVATILLRDYKLSFADEGCSPKLVYTPNLHFDGPMKVRLQRREK